MSAMHGQGGGEEGGVTEGDNIYIYGTALHQKGPEQTRRLFPKTNRDSLHRFHQKIRAVITRRTERAVDTVHSEAFQTLVFVK